MRISTSMPGAWALAIKKTLQPPKAQSGARRIFQSLIKFYEYDKRQIVFIDESGFAHDRPRTHGYAPVGHRCVGTQDWHAAKGRHRHG